jgi:glycosyltransferase involved in cell wall biosynthesis
MRLLICTQAVDLDDPVLGFFHRWIVEFASHCESVQVICLREGRHNLPANVRVRSLGKEKIASSFELRASSKIVARLQYTLRFYTNIWQLRHEYDVVFVHMNPQYVVLGGLVWRWWGKTIGLWYVHRHVTFMLRIAEKVTHFVFTAAQESFAISSTKVHIVGHGIDTARFVRDHDFRMPITTPRIVSVGRVTPIKNLDIAIRAVGLLRDQGIQAHLDVVGEPITPHDVTYKQSLESLVHELTLESYVSFVGPVHNDQVPAVYAQHDLSLNLSPTGGIDKAVLESMAGGVPAIVSNEAFRTYVGTYADMLICRYNDASDVAVKIRTLMQYHDLPLLSRYLETTAQSRCDVRVLISVMMALYE